MKKHALLAGLVGAVMLAATPAFASGGAHGKGSWEVTLTSDSSQGFTPSVGYYVIDNLALTVQARHAQDEHDVSGGGKTDITHTSFGAGLEYNIPTGSPVLPFVGIALLYGKEDEDAPGTGSDHEVDFKAIEVEGGVKVMMGERASINFILSYLTGTEESTSGGAADPDVDITDLSLGLGFSLYFN